MKRYLIVVILLIIAGIGTFVLKKTEVKQVSDPSILNFPREIGRYKSTDIPLKERIYEILQTRNVIMRQYVKEDEPPILFYLIFAQETHKTSDPPENCLRGEGRTIASKTKEVLPIVSKNRNLNLEVNKLLVEKGADKQIYLYWFIAGSEFTDSYFKQRVKLIMAYLKREPLSGGQIRISTTVLNNDTEQAIQRLQVFIEESMPFLLDLFSQ